MFRAARNMPATALTITDLLKALAWWCGEFCAATPCHEAVMILQ
jgi:hypothetical protein